MRNAIIKNFEGEKLDSFRVINVSVKSEIFTVQRVQSRERLVRFWKIFNIQPNKQSTRKGYVYEYFQFSIYLRYKNPLIEYTFGINIIITIDSRAQSRFISIYIVVSRI